MKPTGSSFAFVRNFPTARLAAFLLQGCLQVEDSAGWRMSNADPRHVGGYDTGGCSVPHGRLLAAAPHFRGRQSPLGISRKARLDAILLNCVLPLVMLSAAGGMNVLNAKAAVF
jgi:hypothetical protein